ncbi:MAG: tRNA (adenosine(37)-N6)-threonylcarbamoyltransferase complex transferase subunit TsaD [Lentimicrobiaceae bacterium]|nr:tRNA (adenosine(37)-N6)-threonylcarbamoyltransferase complex transferase subunit TsaD [Lentimicrobiaceae bacterium]MCB9023775.1 tRNA (adenosine(37)-N6)-threonylcarbamoyltransferase complex transferase subunit TsaD [Lentimicrobiaceae bacterium]MCO5265294.1 tRNA (adenosine(37)-N6)-threonylcarbamoyltransferase complex transferase subunit TsaD [Lentimicrobium sp.]HPG32394.1 tRNA (adenosine(37)-N6)-threonylcarbamoyltransferase complex transferase subunit TsaD [Lentimicrobium sp.]
MPAYILGIESSCDDTSAAVICDDVIKSNVIANQLVHSNFGGVVPELASRAHQQNIIPVIHEAMKRAGIQKNELSAVAFTRGPGLLGSLLVGTSFAKAFALALDIPLIEVDHMQAHILAHFIQNPERTNKVPSFPFLCLTVSGGHTQIVKVSNYFEMEIIGRTIDDAAGEAFDKAAKIMSLPYPGGPLIDKFGKEGNPLAFKFARPSIQGLDYSFSGLKTSFLYFLRDRLKEDADFIEKNKNDLCASIQHAIVSSLMEKVLLAVKQTGIHQVAVAGGVSANSSLRGTFISLQEQGKIEAFIPEFQYTTDNAAMIAVAGYFRYLNKDFADLSLSPYSRSGV